MPSIRVASHLDLDGNTVDDGVDPVTADALATKGYVDAHAGSGGGVSSGFRFQAIDDAGAFVYDRVMVDAILPRTWRTVDTQRVTVIDANTFTLPMTVDPGTYTSGGTVAAQEWWTLTDSLNTKVGTEDYRGKHCWLDSATGLLRFGNDNVTSTGGALPATGRVIRIPNVMTGRCGAVGECRQCTGQPRRGPQDVMTGRLFVHRSRWAAASAVGIAVLLLLMVFNASPVQAREGVCPVYSEPVADAERNAAVAAKLSVLLWGPWSPSAQAVHAALGQQDGSYWLVGWLNGWHVNVAPGSKSLGQSRAALESTIRAFFTPKDADLLVKELQVHAVPYAREELEAVQRALQAEIEAEGWEPGTYEVGIDCRASDAPRVELWLSEGIRASHGAQAQAIASHFGDRAALDLGPSKLSFVGGGLGSAPPSTGAPLIPTAGPTISGAGRLTPASVHVTVTAPAPETVTLKLTGRNPAFQITRHVRLRMGRNTLHLRLPRSVGRQLRRRTRMSSNLVVTGATGAAVRKDVRLLR